MADGVMEPGKQERLPEDSPRDGGPGAHVDEDAVRTGLEGACAWGDSPAANGLRGRNHGCSAELCSIESAGPASAPCPDPPGMQPARSVRPSSGTARCRPCFDMRASVT
jgi:hypothetical protein